MKLGELPFGTNIKIPERREDGTYELADYTLGFFGAGVAAFIRKEIHSRCWFGDSAEYADSDLDKRMTEIYPDAAARPSAVIVESKLGAGPSLEVTRPLIFYANDVSDGTPRTMTPQAARIYDTCSFAENDRYQGDNT